MPQKDDRKIVSAIRMPASDKGGRRVFKAGDEEELAKVATQEQLRTYAASGAITGDWGVKVEESGESADDAATSKAASKAKGRK